MMAGILESLSTVWELREQAFVLGLVLLVFAAFLREWFTPDIIAMGAFVVLLVFGILDKDDALAVFGTGAPLIVDGNVEASSFEVKPGLLMLAVRGSVAAPRSEDVWHNEDNLDELQRKVAAKLAAEIAGDLRPNR